MAKKAPIHTFLDDIKYQMVKEDNKRTPFYTSEIQIVNKSKQTLEKLERTRMHVRSEYNRQQVLLENELGKLLLAKRELGLVTSRQSRRHSVPHSLHLATQSTKTPSAYMHPALSVFEKSSLQGGRRTAMNSCGGTLTTNAGVQVAPTSKMAKPVLHDLRRRSYDSTGRTQEGYLSRDPSVMPKGRRTTIAEGLTTRNLIASPEF